MEDPDKTIAPQRHTNSGSSSDLTIPGRRDRKPDGRFAVGDLIMNRYKVLSELGQGGMGVVYKCFDETAGVEVALKALPPELSHNTLEMEDIKENFQLVSKLVHQNIAIAKNLERDISNGNYYLIMECCEGEDLRRWIRRMRKENLLTLEAVLPILQQVAAALDYAHEMKVMHRDIKPGNIMINSEGKIKVLDFGLAAQIHTSMTRVSMAYHGTSGTGPYMAPEQWEGRIQDARADQYALAVMAYEMLSGHTPFESTDAAVLREAVLKSKVVALTDIPKYADAAIQRALSKDPAERFVNCQDLVAAMSGKKVRTAANSLSMFRIEWLIALLIIIVAGTGIWGYCQFTGYQKEKARQEQLRQQISGLLQTARTAAAQGNWQTVQQLTNDVLQLSPEHVESKFLQQTANEQIAAVQRRETEKKQQIALAESAAKQAASQADWPEVLRQAQAILLLDKHNVHAQELVKNAQQQIELKAASDREAFKLLMQETYRLQNQLQRQKEDIDQAGYDRSWTFGQHLDALNKNYDSAQQAIKNNDIKKAHNFLQNARQEADWILKNAPRRKELQGLLEQIPQQKGAAEQFNASQLAFASYQTAAEQTSAARAAGEAGDFNSAITNVRSALANYRKSSSEAQQQTLKNLITSAESAKNNQDLPKLKELEKQIRLLDKAYADELINFMDQKITADAVKNQLKKARQAYAAQQWQQTADFASTALKFDSGNAEAAQLHRQALEKIQAAATKKAQLPAVSNPAPAAVPVAAASDLQSPTLEIITIVDNIRVPATVKFGNLTFNTSERPISLIRGKDYHGTITYKSDWHEYSAEISFNCNWNGHKEQRIQLAIKQLKRLILPGGAALEIAEIPQGSFMRQDGKTITLSKKYWLGKFEVTQAQYQAVMNHNPSSFKGSSRPVENVSWFDARNFCQKLNKYFAGKLPDGYQIDLPTEAQWEYACRAGSVTAYAYGNAANLQKMNCHGSFAAANSAQSSVTGPIEVGSMGYKNNWGLSDMHGNVWEWCSDWYGDYSDNTVDPPGASSGRHRVYRGGSWNDDGKFCTSFSRSGWLPDKGFNFLGFRLAIVPINKTASRPDNSHKEPVSLEVKSDKFALPNGESIEMIPIARGSFKREDNRIVTITRKYYLGKFEVTQAQYQAVMNHNPSSFKGSRLPVENVSWNNAKLFCAKLNAYYAEKLPPGYKFDLPTEAQWEYACRAGSDTFFCYGNSPDTNKMNFDARFPSLSPTKRKGIFRKTTVEVGSLKNPNAFGLYDMHGNVHEWCRDYSKNYTEHCIDPVGPAYGSNRIYRGGSWKSLDKGCGSSTRHNNAPGFFSNDMGFRLALVPEM